MSKRSKRLHKLEADTRYSLGFVAKGSHPGRSAQMRLDAAASSWIREHGGMPRSHYGSYDKGDKFGDRPKWQDRPYRTEMMTSSGKAGRRAMGQKVHAPMPDTRL